MQELVHSKEVLYVNWLSYLLAACAIFYLLTRHGLLVSERLQKEALGCGHCLKATAGLCYSPNPNSAERKELHVVTWLTVGCLLCYLLYCLNQLLMFSSDAIIGWLPFAYCENAYRIGAALYVFSKELMYAVFVARLQLGFQGTNYAYGRCVIGALYALVLLSQVFFLVVAVFYVSGVRTKRDSVENCIADAPLWVNGAGVFFDLCFTVSVVCLFAASLKQMRKDFTEEIGVSQNMEKNADIYFLSLKYALLSLTAIASTMTAVLLFGATHLVFLLPFDCVVNCAALVLMTGKWSPVFDIMCTPLLGCLPCAGAMGAKATLMLRNVGSARRLTDAPSNTDCA